MQIFAKTVLTILGIYAVVNFYYLYPGQYTSQMEESTILREIMSFCAFTALAAFATYFMIFNNDSIAVKIAGLGEQLSRQSQTDLLSKSLRIGLVLAGLMLLPRSVPTIVKIPKIFFLIRPAVNDIIISKSVPKILRLSYAQWYRNIYEFMKTILSIYLLCGAPHLVRWHVKHSLSREIEIQITTKTNSERAKNE